ncbi:MAG: RNA methyltransferase [Parvibaculum sp.]|nr:RNA methyltransferase [Parvibaculum sp.]
MEADETPKSKTPLRRRADQIKLHRCKNLIAVLENPSDIRNIGTVIRNVNALGVEKAYVVDPHGRLPDEWQDMRDRKSLTKTSASAVQWSFVKRFDSTEACLAHLRRNRYVSIVTSPHMKGKTNVVLHEANYTVPTRLAVWFGSESSGISDLAVSEAEFCVNIPMYGIIESLNLGTTTGIVLYEIAKQRRAYQERYKRSRNRWKEPASQPVAKSRSRST